MPKAIKRQLIGLTGDVQIEAAAGESKNPSFSVLAYTGAPFTIAWYDLPVVVDLDGMTFGKHMVANLDHDKTKRVGNVTAKTIADGQLTLSGVASAATPAKEEVIASAKNGFIWQASIEAMPGEITELAAGKSADVNGQTVNGPVYIVRTSTLKGFAFVSHGADENTTVSIAASAAQSKGTIMDKKLKAWIEAMGFVVDDLSEEQLAGMTATYEGRTNVTVTPPKKKFVDLIDARKAEQDRIDAISQRALDACDSRPYEIDKIKALADEAIEGKWTVEKFRIELLEASIPMATGVSSRNGVDRGLTPRVLEAAICMAGRLDGHEKSFSDQELQAAQDRFKNSIGMKQIFLLGAEANGYRAPYSGDVTIEVQRAAFGMTSPRDIRAAGFSTLAIPNVLSNVANKFLRDGWNAVDQTPLKISTIRSVRDFKTITTVSLTGDLDFQKVGTSGEIKHGTLGEETYTNKADTYARMLAITRTDIINDDLGALTAVPRKLGRGAMLMLNDIFWTEFLNNSAFFSAGNVNVNTGVADMTVGGLSATEAIFMSLTDPDGKPLGIQPEILLVPTALKSAALTLMQSEMLIDGSATVTGTANIWRNRFRVESSPYMHNTAYTGYSAVAWYMLADPGVMPVIEIAALNGRVEPTIETADADFNVLGVQMRGYSDVGVNLQEYRGGVRADGGAS